MESFQAVTIICVLGDGEAYCGGAFQVELDEKLGPFFREPESGPVCPRRRRGRLCEFLLRVLGRRRGGERHYLCHDWREIRVGRGRGVGGFPRRCGCGVSVNWFITFRRFQVEIWAGDLRCWRVRPIWGAVLAIFVSNSPGCVAWAIGSRAYRRQCFEVAVGEACEARGVVFSCEI